MLLNNGTWIGKRRGYPKDKFNMTNSNGFEKNSNLKSYVRLKSNGILKHEESLKSDDSVKWDIRLKVWFEIDGNPIIGDGRLAMLNAIHQNGSIIEAARQIGVSYRKIRGALRDMEKHMGKPLVRAYRGGGHGGGADLTPEAHQLIELYKKIKNRFEQEVSAYQKEASVMLQHQEVSVMPESVLPKNFQANGNFCPSLENML